MATCDDRKLLFIKQHSVSKMAYSNSYASRQWPALQTSSWPDSDMGWGTSTVTDGTSPESSSVSRTESPLKKHEVTS